MGVPLIFSLIRFYITYQKIKEIGPKPGKLWPFESTPGHPSDTLMFAALQCMVSLDNKIKLCDQLMELAGQSVAICSARTAPPGGKILVCAGPGNNGGDGLVAARHLIHFGRKVDIYYPKRPAKTLYQNLFESAQLCGVNVVEDIDQLEAYSQIIDAIFGFSFNPDGGIRAPFDHLVAMLSKTHVPILSVDVPSGWNVDKGPVPTVPCKLFYFF